MNYKVYYGCSNTLYNYRFIVYALIITIALVHRFYSSQIIHLDPDAGGYLMPALNYFTEGVFTHNDSRNYLYPLFIFSVLSVLKSLKTIAVIQHITGIITGFILIVFFEKIRIEKKIISEKNRFIWLITTLFVVSSFLLSGNIMLFEHTLRPEAFISFYLTIYLITLYYFFRNQNSVVYFFVSVLSIVGMMMFPRLLLSNIVSIVITTILFIKNKSIKPSGKITAIFVSVLLSFLLILPEYVLLKKYDLNSRVFAARQMFYSYSHIILKSLKENNYPDNSPEAINRELKNKFESYIEHKPDKKWKPILGYDPDDLQYGDCNRFIENYFFNEKNYNTDVPIGFDKKIESLNKFYYSWLKFIALKYPFDFIKKILHQYFHVFLNYKVSMVSYTLLIYDLNSSYKPVSLKAKNYLVNELQYPLFYKQTFKIFRPLHIYQFILILIFKLAFPFVIIYGCISLNKNMSYYHLLFLFLFSGVTLVAVSHTFDIPRYLHSLLIPFLFLLSFSLFKICKIDK